jgi:hypothetical protein
VTAHEYLANCRELRALCSQDGFIDNDTLSVEIQAETPETVTAWVEFDEVLVEGAGCVADRVSCAGWVRLIKDTTGQIATMELI